MQLFQEHTLHLFLYNSVIVFSPFTTLGLSGALHLKRKGFRKWYLSK